MADFNLKTYKQKKIQTYLKSIKLVFFFQGISVTTKNWITFEQSCNKKSLVYYKIFNTLLVNVLKTSSFKNLIPFINGPVIIIVNNDYYLTLKKLEIENSLVLLGLKLNNKIYSKSQISNLRTFSYTKSVFKLYKQLNALVILPYVSIKQ